MAFTLTIGGVTKSALLRTLSISLTANGRGTASFGIHSADASYRPALDDEVIVTEDGTRIFGGLVDQPRERGVVNASKDNIITVVNAVDFNAYAERRYITGTFPGGTLKAFLTFILPFFTVYLVTLDAAQVDGPTLPALTFDDTLALEALNKVMGLTAEAGEPFAWNFDPFKVLSAKQPSTVPSPFNITGSGVEVIGDLEVETARGRDYANRVIVKVPTKSDEGREESFTGDGVTTTFQLTYTLIEHYGLIHIYELDGVTPAGGETFGIPPDAPIQWSYNPATNQITRTVGPTDATKIYRLRFNGTYTGRAVAEDASATTDPFEKVIPFPLDSDPDAATLQAFADAELARRLPIPKTIKYRTRKPGLVPGQSQLVTVARRNLSAVTAVISEVVIRDLIIKDATPTDVIRHVTAVIDASQTNLGRGWRDLPRLWSADRIGAGTSMSITAPATIGPAPPVGSVQYNGGGGAFKGSEHFKWHEAVNSMHAGEGCSIESATSCVAIGLNCRVAP